MTSSERGSDRNDPPTPRATGSPDSEESTRAREEIADRLRHRGVVVAGNETGEELVNLLDAVERFETQVELSGGDLMVDEPVGAGRPTEPDDEAFVLPRRHGDEPVSRYLARIAEATSRAKGKRRGGGGVLDPREP